MKQFPNIMNPADREKWIQAGKIASEVREWTAKIIKPGARLEEVADKIEDKIKDMGALPGFPVNLSLNDCAAHYTPTLDDPIVLKDEVIKVDVGVLYEGAIGDTAHTIDLSGNYGKLVEASRKALDNVTKELCVGMPIGKIGRIVEETIQSYGFEPIRNLSGHGIAMHEIHTSPGIPNFDTKDATPLQKGMIIAIEPFATDGAGKIKNGGDVVIYEEQSHKSIRSMTARKVARAIEEFHHVPFARRWLDKKFGVNTTSLALRQLQMNGNIVAHAPLMEVGGGMVSQAEHTFLIDDDVVCLTK